MQRWVALSLLGMGVSWGPYLYGLGSRPQTTVSPLTAADDSDDSPPLTAAPVEALAPPAAAPLMAAKPEPTPEAPPTAAEAAAPNPVLSAPAPSIAAGPGFTSEAKPVSTSAALLPAFRNAFEREPRDAFWANDEESHLSQLIQAAGVPDGGVSEVACRRSVCRVSFNKGELGADVESKLSASLHQESGASISIGPIGPDQAEHPPYYLLRNGFDLDLRP